MKERPSQFHFKKRTLNRNPYPIAIAYLLSLNILSKLPHHVIYILNKYKIEKLLDKIKGRIPQ